MQEERDRYRGSVAFDETEIKRLRRLSEMLAFVRTRGLKSLETEQLTELTELYRHACTQLARRETRGESGQSLDQLRNLASTAHGLLFRGTTKQSGTFVQRAVRMLMVESPRAIRAEWKLLFASFFLMYGLAIASYYAVSRDLSMAFSLLAPEAVSNEISQLSELAPGEAFRGNFTFGIGEAPQTATLIMFHNMGVGVLFFAAALIPPLYIMILATNGLMLGTYTAVAGHWDQAGSISSILWCHGVIEIQAIILAATAGLVLVRGLIAPGARTRGYALKAESSRAWALLAPVFPLLFISGLIEGFVSPLMPTSTRIAVAVLTGIGLLMWVGLSGLDSARTTRVEPGRQ